MLIIYSVYSTSADISNLEFPRALQPPKPDSTFSGRRRLLLCSFELRPIDHLTTPTPPPVH